MSVVEKTRRAAPVRVSPPIEVPIEEWRLMLLQAADLLMEKGWIQGASNSAFGFCAIGAIEHIGGITFVSSYAKEVLAYEIHCGYSSIPQWNDKMPGQTRDNVVATMRRAATR